MSRVGLVGCVHGAPELAAALSERIYRRSRPTGVGRWMRHGLLPGLRHPGIRLAVGSPAPYSTDGLADWLQGMVGDDATSPAAPLVFEPVMIHGRRYVDGGVLSGTNADLVLGSSDPLDLVLVIAPMAAAVARPAARFYEGIIDRLGSNALAS